MRRSRLAASFPVLALASAAAVVALIAPAGASNGNGNGKPPKPPRTTTTVLGTTTTTAPTTTTTTRPAGGTSFATGQLQGATVGASGCGTNGDGEPAIHVSRANTLVLGSERGLGGGSDAWRQLNTTAGPGVSACSLQYTGQPNAVGGVGASGGDIDLAFGSALNSAGTYTVYVASLNGGSVSVAHSSDNGATYTNVPVQGGLPGDDREWIAAYGADTSLLTFHDVATNDIDVLRSTNGGSTYTQVSEAIPETDYKAGNNELGNIVIDHRNASPVAGGFWAYQSFVAPSSDPGLLGSAAFNEAFVAVSNDGGSTWSDQPVPCSTSNTDLDHNFPNVSVDPAGNIWTAWSDDTNVYTAVSRDHGATWTCSPKVSTNTAQAIFPWLVATSSGVDLVYYGAPTTGKSQTWSVYFAQDPTGSATGWGTPSPVVTVHSGSICESGVTCNGGRQLFDDFGVDTDQSGWAHIAYSHDAPDLGGMGTYTGYAVQTGGTPVGFPN